ncbi:MAG: c-type cytochrome [Candidatus Angelobacter sp.]
MRHRTLWIASLLIVLLIALGVFLLGRFSLTSLDEPGRFETAMANKGKHFLVQRASRQGIPERPGNHKASIAEGDMLYGVDCSMCHGRDGRTPTDMGRWMYPRAADLGSAEVQTYSDRELFWIIRNGIRLSGMPAFGKVESNEHIWNLADYVRTIPQHPPTKVQPK